MHKAFELRIKNGTPLPLGMGQHEWLLAKLAAAPGTIHAEQKLAMSSSFTPTAFFARDAWFRTVVDYTAINGASATVVDYKSGRVTEDETQLKLMAAMLFCHAGQLSKVKSALVFVNQKTIIPAHFVREDLTEIWSEVLPRVKAVEKALATQEFPPKPSGLCKRYCAVSSCPYHGR